MASTVNIHDAKTHFSRLIERVLRGERITIAKAGRPVAVLGPVDDPPATRTPGMDKGRLIIHADFDEPLPELDADFSHPTDPLH